MKRRFKAMEAKYDVSLWAAGIMFWFVIVLTAFWAVGAFAHGSMMPHAHAQANVDNPPVAGDPDWKDPDYDYEGAYEGAPSDTTWGATAIGRKHTREGAEPWCKAYLEKATCESDDTVKCSWNEAGEVCTPAPRADSEWEPTDERKVKKWKEDRRKAGKPEKK